ncbi:MAG: hypothetical protein KGI27_09775 [Thaumarchaeota archaeon]|nr:hypothetical protein [Nitrososphaerota archaeon]
MTQPHNKKAPMNQHLMDKIDHEIKLGRLSPSEGACLAMVEIYIRSNPDGRFAEMLVSLLGGE